MSSRSDKRFKGGVVLVTLALVAFFLAQGAMAFFGAEALDDETQAESPRARRSPVTSVRKRHDPNLILRRNIFNSALGDLTQVQAEPTEVDGELILDDEEEVNKCETRLRLAGTAVVPGDFDRSLAVIVGTDQETKVHQGSADVEGFRIRAIHYDSVYLQTGADLCKLAMFVPDASPTPVKRAVRPETPKKDDSKKTKRRSRVDRNAGLSDEEIAEGIEKVNDRTFNIRRTLLNKVLDGAGRLIGIAAVSPKMENGESVGMQIRGIRSGTLLEKLGIKNQDVLESVNGDPLSSPDAALGAYTTLRTADKFVLAVNRDGESLQITYNLN